MVKIYRRENHEIRILNNVTFFLYFVFFPNLVPTYGSSENFLGFIPVHYEF
jgi:hypothetical protein